MLWPADHPAVTDAALAIRRHGADEICGDATVVQLLRHLKHRRVASLVATSQGPAVLKVFASPRARGNDRRLATLAATPLAPFIPVPLGVDSAGHVSLVSYTPGVVFDRLPDETFVSCATLVGQALRRFHTCGAHLDRQWSISDEISQLRRRATARVKALLDIADRLAARVADDPLVPAHRDCHPWQVVVTRTDQASTQGDDSAGPAARTSDTLGADHLPEPGDASHHVRWIDLDDTAKAPPGLDVGNFCAHLRRDAAIGARSWDATQAALDNFLAGYQHVPPTTSAWEGLALVRLVGLAESRNGRPDWADAIAAQLNPDLGLNSRPNA